MCVDYVQILAIFCKGLERPQIMVSAVGGGVSWN